MSDPTSTESWTGADPRAQVDAMLSVSRKVAEGGSLDGILDAIATEVAGIARGALATSIMLIAGRGQPWRMAGSYGLSAGYGERVRRWPTPERDGRTLSELTVQLGCPVVIDDTETDPRYEDWREIARIEGFRSFLSVPLGSPGAWLGSLNVYRSDHGSWPQGQVDLVAYFADHAASAIRTAQLLERERSEVVGLQRLVRALQEQTHEHANRLHAVSGLLALGALDEARGILTMLENVHHEMRQAVETHVRRPALAGLLLADFAIAHQRSIALEIDPRGRFEDIERGPTDAQLITVVGNLLDNAFDAVADMPLERRRVRITLDTAEDHSLIRVRDWGPGVRGRRERLFERGVTTRAGHSGIGLALVKDATRAALGEINVRRHDDGTTFTVTLPHAA
jgi:signal transduction histidine kinase